MGQMRRGVVCGLNGWPCERPVPLRPGSPTHVGSGRRMPTTTRRGCATPRHAPEGRKGGEASTPQAASRGKQADEERENGGGVGVQPVNPCAPQPPTGKDVATALTHICSLAELLFAPWCLLFPKNQQTAMVSFVRRWRTRRGIRGVFILFMRFVQRAAAPALQGATATAAGRFRSCSVGLGSASRQRERSRARRTHLPVSCESGSLKRATREPFISFVSCYA